MVQIPKEKTYKVVRNSNNTDQYLVKFYYSMSEAEQAASVLNISNNGQFFVAKRTNPEMILNPVPTDYEHYNRALIPDEEWIRVMASDASVEINCDYMTCGVGTYYNLSKMINKQWTVVDIGCSYNAQSYLFQDHARYIAIDPKEDFEDFHIERFQAPNTEFYETTGQEFMRKNNPLLRNLDIESTFCIVNYVPDDDCIFQALSTFKNIWVYYPHERIL